MSQKYDYLMKFTSKGSIKKYGAPKILDFYKNIRVSYKLKNGSESFSGDTTTLNYTTTEFATNKIKQFVVVSENDTVKLVLPNKLSDFLK